LACVTRRRLAHLIAHLYSMTSSTNDVRPVMTQQLRSGSNFTQTQVHYCISFKHSFFVPISSAYLTTISIVHTETACVYVCPHSIFLKLNHFTQIFSMLVHLYPRVRCEGQGQRSKFMSIKHFRLWMHVTRLWITFLDYVNAWPFFGCLSSSVLKWTVLLRVRVYSILLNFIQPAQ